MHAPERAHGGAPADRLELRDQIHGSDLRRARDRAAGERRRRGAPRGPRRRGAFPPRSRPCARRPRARASAISSGQRTVPGSHTRERSFRSRSTIITCSAASFSDSASSAALAERSRALDRHRPDPPPAAGEEELGRGGDDRPAVADERLARAAAAASASRAASPRAGLARRTAPRGAGRGSPGRRRRARSRHARARPRSRTAPPSTSAPTCPIRRPSSTSGRRGRRPSDAAGRERQRGTARAAAGAVRRRIAWESP